MAKAINNGIISHTNRYILVGKTYTVTKETDTLKP